MCLCLLGLALGCAGGELHRSYCGRGRGVVGGVGPALGDGAGLGEAGDGKGARVRRRQWRGTRNSAGAYGDGIWLRKWNPQVFVVSLGCAHGEAKGLGELQACMHMHTHG